jgi:hypothetical protein
MQPTYPPTQSLTKHPTFSPTNQSSEDVAANLAVEHAKQQNPTGCIEDGSIAVAVSY